MILLFTILIYKLVYKEIKLFETINTILMSALKKVNDKCVNDLAKK